MNSVLSPERLSEFETTLRKEVYSLQATLKKTRTKTREGIKNLLEHEQSKEVTNRIASLQLRIKLLVRLRENLHIFDDSALELRINQLRGLNKLAEFLAESDLQKLSGYFRQPTGSGKTVLFGIITRLFDVRTLILAPRTNLLTQAKDELKDVVEIPEEHIGIVMATEQEMDTPITISTYQSHLSRMKSDVEYQKAMANLELIICDEAHRSMGDQTHQSIVKAESELIGVYDNEISEEEEQAEQEALEQLAKMPGKALRLGFTATPILANKNVADYFGPCISEEKYSDMIAAGICVPYKLIRVDGTVTELDLDKAMTEEREAEILQREGTYRKLLGAYAETLQLFRDKKHESEYPMRAVAFCVNIAECDRFAEEAKAMGMRSMIVTGREAKGKNSEAVIQEAEEKLTNGEIDLIITVKKLAEGWNYKPANAAIWARACTSPADVIQGIGRTGRAYLDPVYGKKNESFVFETRWDVKNGKKKNMRPLGIADALARSGEDPSLICTNVDQTPLEHEIPFSRDVVEQEMRASYTPDTWSNMEYWHMKKLVFAGRKYGIGIAKLFGLQDNPKEDRSTHLAIGRAVWGAVHVLKDKAMLRQEVTDDARARFTPETWKNMSKEERQTLVVADMKYGEGIASLFDIRYENPVSYNETHEKVRVEIWPTEVARERAEEEIRRSFTPEMWAVMTPKEREELRIWRRQYATEVPPLFNMMENAAENDVCHLAIGTATFGHADILKNKEEVKEKIQQEILQQFTPETWVAMESEDKENLKVAGLQYNSAVRRLFGANVHLQRWGVGDEKQHFAVGRNIWGDVDILRDKDELREDAKEEILTRFTPETWAAMTSEEKQSLVLAKRPYNEALAELFEIYGDPITYHSQHLALGKKVWRWQRKEKAEVLEIDNELLFADVKQYILTHFTAKSWLELSGYERKGLRIAGHIYGIKIAKLFGVEGNPSGATASHQAIGVALWGDFKKFEVNTDEETRELIKQEIRTQFTPEIWAAMKVVDKQKLVFGGINYNRKALRTLFGPKADADPTCHHYVHITIGKAAFGPGTILDDIK